MRAAAVLLVLSLVGCVSLLQQRDYQLVQWQDGDSSRIEVWTAQGTSWHGQPWYFVLETIGTPVVWLAETALAISAWRKPDVAIAGGPLGYLLSLLPGFTCMPLDLRSRGLRLQDALHLPPDARLELDRLDSGQGVEWLARQFEALGGDGLDTARSVRDWVVSVRLVPPATDPGR